MEPLSLAQASKIVDVALEKGVELKCKPLTVVVLDAGGHMVALKRSDTSGIMRPQIAQAKAWGALGMGAGSRNLAQRAAEHPGFFGALTDISQGRIAPVPGGVLIRDAGGYVIGAVGISGDMPDRDEACGVAGIAATGLTADVG